MIVSLLVRLELIDYFANIHRMNETSTFYNKKRLTKDAGRLTVSEMIVGLYVSFFSVLLLRKRRILIVNRRFHRAKT